MSNTQKRGPGRPKGMKNQPGAKAGHPRKDAVKAKGPNPHKTLPSQNAGMHDIFEVEICFSLFLSDLASSAHADINSDSTMMSCQLASSGEQIFIFVTVAFAFVLIYCQI